MSDFLIELNDQSGVSFFEENGKLKINPQYKNNFFIFKWIAI